MAASATDESDEEYFDKETREITDCITSQTPVSTDICRKVNVYLKENPHHREGNHIFFEAEWKIRKELHKKGLNLPKAIIPLDYAWKASPGGEIVVTLGWSPYYRNEPETWDDRTKNQAFWLAYLAKILPENEIEGDYGNVVIFTKQGKASKFELSNSMRNLWGTWVRTKKERIDDRTLDDCFKSPGSRECPLLRRVGPGIYGVCFTHYWSENWPEIHIWDDRRASIGDVMLTFAFVDGRYKQIGIKQPGHYQTVTVGTREEWAFVDWTRGQGYSSEWSFAVHLGSVYLWNSKKNILEKSEALTNKMFPIKDLKIGKGTPKRAGLFIRREDRQIYRFLKRSATGSSPLKK